MLPLTLLGVFNTLFLPPLSSLYVNRRFFIFFLLFVWCVSYVIFGHNAFFSSIKFSFRIISLFQLHAYFFVLFPPLLNSRSSFFIDDLIPDQCLSDHSISVRSYFYTGHFYFLPDVFIINENSLLSDTSLFFCPPSSLPHSAPYPPPPASVHWCISESSLLCSYLKKNATMRICRLLLVFCFTVTYFIQSF